MFRYLFNAAAGPWWARALAVSVLVSAGVVALFLWGFPALQEYLPLDELTVG